MKNNFQLNEDKKLRVLANKIRTAVIPSVLIQSNEFDFS